MTSQTNSGITLGLKQNLAQFSVLVGVNALVGGMIGQERTVLPLLAEEEFGLTAFTATAFAHIDDSATCSSTFSNRCDEITPPSLATHTLVPLCPACTIIDNASSPPPTFAL